MICIEIDSCFGKTTCAIVNYFKTVMTVQSFQMNFTKDLPVDLVQLSDTGACGPLCCQCPALREICSPVVGVP